MDTTFVIGAFFPTSARAGERYAVDYHIPLKITVEQEDMIESFPELLESFLEEAFMRLEKLDPDIVKQYADGYAFGVGDPTSEASKRFVYKLKALKSGAIDMLHLDLTDFRLSTEILKAN